MTWCEDNGVDYIFGLARNERLVKAIHRQLAQARRESRHTKQAARRFKILEGWETRDSWSLPRRVIAKAEWTHGEANPRFLVTSITWIDDARCPANCAAEHNRLAFAARRSGMPSGWGHAPRAAHEPVTAT